MFTELPMAFAPKFGRIARVVALPALLLNSGCATTTFTATPSPQPPVCQGSSERLNAVVLWSAAWRTDQKDVQDRERAAAQGINRFFAESNCFWQVDIRQELVERVDRSAADPVAADRFDRSIVLVVRELGPVLRIGASPALIEGGTEVLLDVTVYLKGRPASPQRFTAHWMHGGAGVVKGVASLPDDMVAALKASLQPAAR